MSNVITRKVNRLKAQVCGTFLGPRAAFGDDF